MSLGQYIGLHLYITKGGQSLSLVCHDCSECSSVSYPRFLMTSGRVWNYNFCYLHLFLQSIQNFSTWIAQYITKFSMCQILIIKKFSLAESHPAILHAPFPAAPPHDITFSFKNKDTPLFYSLWSIPSVDDHCHLLGSDRWPKFPCIFSTLLTESNFIRVEPKFNTKTTFITANVAGLLTLRCFLSIHKAPYKIFIGNKFH